MKRRKWLWVLLGVVVAVGGGLLVYRKVGADQDEAAFQEQMRLARAEGIPTTAAEYAATMPPAKPEENAAPLYRQMQSLLHVRGDSSRLEADLQFRPSPAHLKAAQAYLDQLKPALELADRAAALPRCWFDRDWKEGMAVLMPEFATMKGAAKLIALRASIAAQSGDSKSALKDAARIFQLARQARDEHTAIAHLVSEAIEAIGLRELATWSFLYGHPSTLVADGVSLHRTAEWFLAQKEYAAALAKAAEAMPPPNLRQEHSDDLFGMLSLIDLSSTPEGRKKLGLREEDIGAGQKLIPVLLSQPKARIQIVRGERAYWAALAAPEKDQASLMEDANLQIQKGLFAFPVAWQIYNLLSDGDPLAERRQTWETRRQQYLALARALTPDAIPKTIKTADLLSPFDGKPLTYKFDGKQIVISVSGYNRYLKLPTDAALGKKSKP